MKLIEKVDRYQAAINEVRPFEGHILNEIKAYYRVGLTWSSNALEGNTLTETETKILLEDGLTAGGKPLRDTFEALGHAQAYDFMFSLLRSGQIIKTDTLTMHRMFYRDIDEAYAGKYRDKQVFITGSKYPVAVIPPVLCQEYINSLELAHKDDRPFINFITQRVYETQKEIMRLLHIHFPDPA